MNWLGLDWVDIFINVVALAIVPGLLAAYGGHLAAEAIGDPKRSRTIKYYFWGLFAFGVLVTFWQQFRVAEADLDRSTKDTWAQTLALSKFLPSPAPAYVERRKVGTVPRSYLTIDGTPRFPQRIGPDQHPGVGDEFAINIFFKVSGPNQVELTEIARRLYVESDSSTKTQERLIADFKGKLLEWGKTHSTAGPVTIMPGDQRFFTAFTATTSEESRKVSNDDLEQLRAGTEIVVVIAQLTYKDKGTIHHTKTCGWLQPPADPPGIWHVCDGFNKSD